MGLNERVLALRDLKKRIVENVTNDTLRLNQINALLSDSKSDDDDTQILTAPTIDVRKEWPSERYTVKPSELREFERVLEAEREAKSGSANAFGGGGSSKASATKIKGVAAQSAKLKSSEAALSYQKRLSAVTLSDLERKQLATRNRKLCYEKRVLLDKMSSTITSFDSAVGELREEKYKLLNDLKLTELKLLTLLKELSVLSKFEEREIELNGKLLRCRTEKAQVVVDLTECQERLSSKLEEIHLWQEKDAKIMKEFDNIVGERNAFYDELKRIFKRKIKRHKRGGNKTEENKDGDEFDDSDSSLESSDESGLESGDDGVENGNGGAQKKSSEHQKKEDDSCPKDCDNLIYEKVMELREKRLDQEEILMEFEKAVDELKSQNVALISKEKQIDRSLAATEKEIELFQTEKQQFLNKIVITVPLLLSQMRVGAEVEVLPATIEHLLIFELKSLDRLQQRIVAQRHEKLAVKKEYVELKKLHKSLTKKINAKQSNIDVEKRKCEQVQFLKYGRLVSLEVLDLNNTSNAETIALKVKLEKLSAEYKHRHALWDKKLATAKSELRALIERNTKGVEALSTLKSRQNALKRELDKILDIDVIKDSAPSDQKRNRELQKLVEVAKTQANEIDVLKAEIHMLQRKGGMLYAVPEI